MTRILPYLVCTARGTPGAPYSAWERGLFPSRRADKLHSSWHAKRLWR